MKNLFESKYKIVYLFDVIDQESSCRIISEIMDKCYSSDKVILLINSPGGSVIDALAVYDVIHYYKDKIITVGAGIVGSIATLLFTSAKKGNRYLFKHTTVHIHLPMGITEIDEERNKELVTEEMRLTHLVTKLFLKHTDNTLDLSNIKQKENVIFNANDAVNIYKLADFLI